ncbi:MAG: hypothetical protein J6S63_00375 [Atopobiaceae bacterium]|nr:hypothetical protein [Atopobiaceae bacterium]
MSESDGRLFRQKAIDKMSSPDELTDYLKVTSPSVWAVLVAVVVLLAGIIAWACVGTLPTRAQASIVVQGGTASVSVSDSYDLGAGMRVSVESHNSAIDSVVADEHGRQVGHAQLDLPDGTYKGTVVVDETRAIDFLLQSA